MSEQHQSPKYTTAMRRALIPLALAQFICSFAGSSMNVMINDISKSLHTTVSGVQVAITAFLLVMAALMIPGGKLSDKFGRKRCLNVGLLLFGVGALISALSPNLAVLMLGYSVFEGVGTALLIPPVYILTTLYFHTTEARAWAFGAISGLGGIGAAAGPLIGGAVTSWVGWRTTFLLHVCIVALILILTRRAVTDPLPADRSAPFDVGGAVLSAGGLILLVCGILAADDNLWACLGLLLAGALVLAWFFAATRRKERSGRPVLLATSLFHSRTSNLGLVTQNAQWLMLMGTSFVVSAFLQVVRGFSAIETGLVFTAATIGLLISSFSAERLAGRYAQRTLIIAGFVFTIVGIVLLAALVAEAGRVWPFLPPLFLVGLGVGLMLTPSVNVVQSSFGEQQQGEISGLSRSVSNLGSSLGTAIAGTILVAGVTKEPNNAYALAMATVAFVGLVGLAAALYLPRGGLTVSAPPATQPSPSAH